MKKTLYPVRAEGIGLKGTRDVSVDSATGGMVMRKVLFCAAIALGAFSFAASAQATIVSYNLDFEFSGGDEPEGPPPWMTVSFDDGGGTGSVLLTISTAGLVEQEIAEAVYLNFDTANFDVTQLVFTPGGANTAVASSISLGVDAFKADGDGWYDILVDYPPPPGNGATLLGAGETVTYTITLAGITADSFDFLSTPGGGNGVFHAAAHILRIDSTAGENAGSGWIGDTNGPPPPEIPEPMTMLLFGTGLVGLAGARRRMRNQ